MRRWSQAINPLLMLGLHQLRNWDLVAHRSLKVLDCAGTLLAQAKTHVGSVKGKIVIIFAAEGGCGLTFIGMPIWQSWQ